ncbi:MAG: energy-coupling factor transporter ATPase [Clostridia bacterium]|nr:energy-coupling factor transporter ATPase [Clostridia bacterium]
MKSIIKVENLSYIYQEGMPFEKHALHNVDLEIEEGDFAALIGHTGSGKSTLIQHFNALVKPTSGKIYIYGVDITSTKADLKQIRRMVGLVFQYPEHQLFEETVYKDIAFGPMNIGFSESEVKDRVYEAIRLVGIGEDKLEKSPFELSGGQKRRVAIAGVLAMKPRVLILDEPTAGLDPAGRDDILSSIRALHEAEKDMTVIFVSHSMEDVAKIAKSVIVMNDGRVFAHGSVAEVFSRGRELSKIGLNVPQITQLVLRLRELGVPLSEDIYTVDAAVEAVKAIIRGDRHA